MLEALSRAYLEVTLMTQVGEVLGMKKCSVCVSAKFFLVDVRETSHLSTLSFDQLLNYFQKGQYDKSL